MPRKTPYEIPLTKYNVVDVVLSGTTEMTAEVIRYDSMVPATEADAMAMTRDEYGPTGVRVARAIRFKRYFPVGNDPNPNVRRLASFGWTVVCVGGLVY